jgi:hypothetical protein
MAVNDPESTSRLREASLYFGELLKKMSSREEMRIEDAEMGSMLKEAAYAVSVLSDNDPFRKNIFEKLEKNGIPSPDAVSEGISSRKVSSMCESYATGHRNFDRYSIENARRVCDTVLAYVSILERENKESRSDKLELI